MDDKYLVGLDEYKILDENNPIGYVRDIHSCIAVLVHREKDSILIHSETYEDDINIDKFGEIIKNNDENNVILSVDVFKGEYTSEGALSIIFFILHRFNIKCRLFDVFKNLSNETSVGYNFINKNYYSVRMDKGKPKMRVKELK